jgi:hypothetical protein
MRRSNDGASRCSRGCSRPCPRMAPPRETGNHGYVQVRIVPELDDPTVREIFVYAASQLNPRESSLSPSSLTVLVCGTLRDP